MDYIIINSPVSNLKLTSNNKYLLEVLFTKEKICLETDNIILINAKKEFDEYFSGKRKKFNIPIKQKTNTFSLKVYKALKEIPYGETASYKDIAKKVQSPKAYRAVGNANANNDLPIIIPCHRVITANGKLGGYSGGIGIKDFLLNHESKFK